MSGKKKHVKNFKFIDFMIILIFLLSASLFSAFFYLDWMQTLTSRSEEQAGIIVIKDNVVQRRLSDRVIWDRLYADSPVYFGDVIKIAERSSATLDIDGAISSFSENSMFRIPRSADGDGQILIKMFAGNIDIDTTSSKSSFVIDLAGYEAVVGPGAVVNASAGENGIVVKVSEGDDVFFKNDAESRQITHGTMIAMNSEGVQNTGPNVIMIYPKSSARYLKNAGVPLPVSFAWHRVNLASGAPLRLEISSDRNFYRIVYANETIETSARAVLDAGSWFWRLSYDSDILSFGMFTITDGSGVELISPSINSLFHYREALPVLNFHWTEADDALHYILEVSETPDFNNLKISRQTAAVFLEDSSLGQGTWYWRIKPVFPLVYEGSISGAVYSNTSVFRIEQNRTMEESQLVVLEREEPEIEPAPQIQEPAPRPIIPPVRTTAPSPAPEQTPLPAPGNTLPVSGYRIGIEELKTRLSVNFSWSAVQGANAYIFSLYRQTDSGRRQIIRGEPENSLVRTIDDIRELDRGTFFWQVEAVNVNRNGSFERRGRVRESSFTIDVPYAGTVHIDDTGIFYGN